METVIGEPGFWLLAAMLGFSAHQALGAFLARAHYREINLIVDEVMSSPDTTQSDKKIVAYELYSATVRWPYWLLVLMAPFLGVAGIIFALLLFFMPGMRAKIHSRIDIDDIDLAILDGQPKLESAGPLWQNERRERLFDHGSAAQTLSTPLFTVWVGLAITPALALMALSGAIEPTQRALKTVVASLSRWMISAKIPRHAA